MADRALRHGCQEFLLGHGYRVETADNGLECLTSLRKFVPSKLVLDLELLWVDLAVTRRAGHDVAMLVELLADRGGAADVGLDGRDVRWGRDWGASSSCVFPCAYGRSSRAARAADSEGHWAHARPVRSSVADGQAIAPGALGVGLATKPAVRQG
jgi:hypothetical protein